MSEEKRSAGFAGRGSTADPGTPLAQGLYDPALDKDSCGVGFIADIKGRKSHQIVEDGLRILCNLEHRGATRCRSAHGRRRRHPGADPAQVFRARSRSNRLRAAEPGEYAVGYLFMPQRHELATDHPRHLCRR